MQLMPQHNAATPRSAARQKELPRKLKSKSVNFQAHSPEQAAAKEVVSMDYSVCFSPSVGDTSRDGWRGQAADYR